MTPTKPTLDHRITLDGVLFILFAFAIGFAAYNTGNALLYLILSMMLAFLALSGYLAYQTLARLEARRHVPRRVFARTPAPVTLEIASRKRFLTSYSLRIKDTLASGANQGFAFLLMLPAGESRSVSYDAVFPERGLHRFASCNIYTRYPFGFFERHLTLPMSEEVLVYPHVRRFRQPPEGAMSRLGEFSSSLRGQGVELRALREHQLEDPARLIHWKASARSGRLIVKDTERDAQERFHLLLNNAVPRPADPGVREAFEEAVEFCASMTAYLLQRGFSMQLVTRSGTVTLGGSLGEADRVFRTLALLQLLPEAEARPLPRRRSLEAEIQIGFADNEARLSRYYLPRREWRPSLLQSEERAIGDLIDLEEMRGDIQSRSTEAVAQ